MSEHTIRAQFSQSAPWNVNSKANVTGLPPTLYLHVSGNVEWNIFMGHAWGNASVSTDPGGTQPYPVANLTLRIIMDTPDKQDGTNGAQNQASVNNDVKWGGTTPIFSGPHSTFVATASDPNYGSWSTSTTVY